MAELFRFPMGPKTAQNFDTAFDDGILETGVMVKTNEVSDQYRNKDGKPLSYYVVNNDNSEAFNSFSTKVIEDIRDPVGGLFTNKNVKDELYKGFISAFENAVQNMTASTELPDPLHNQVSLLVIDITSKEAPVKELSLSMTSDGIPMHRQDALAFVANIIKTKDGQYILPSEGTPDLDLIEQYIASQSQSADLSPANFRKVIIGSDSFYVKFKPLIALGDANDNNDMEAKHKHTGFFRFWVDPLAPTFLSGTGAQNMWFTNEQLILLNDVLAAYHTQDQARSTPAAITNEGNYDGCIVNTKQLSDGKNIYELRLKMNVDAVTAILGDLQRISADRNSISPINPRHLALVKLIQGFSDEELNLFFLSLHTFKVAKEDYSRIDHAEVGVFTTGALALFGVGAYVGHKLIDWDSKLGMRLQVLTKGALRAYGTDLTELARQGRIERIEGRDSVVRKYVDVFFQRENANPLLVGPPGEGKTSIAHQAAYVFAQEYPRIRYIEISITKMLAGTVYRGMFEERLQNTVDEASLLREIIYKASAGDDVAKGLLKTLSNKWAEIKKINVRYGDEETFRDRASKPYSWRERLNPWRETFIFLFSDEIQMLLGTVGKEGGANHDAANTLKPGLANGTVRMGGATTDEELRQIDEAIQRRLEKVPVDPMTEAELFTAVRNKANALSKFHGGVVISDAVVSDAIQIARADPSSAGVISIATKILDACASEVSGEKHRDKKQNNVSKTYEVTRDAVRTRGQAEINSDINAKIAQIERKVNWFYSNGVNVPFDKSVFIQQTTEVRAEFIRRVNHAATGIEQLSNAYMNGTQGGEAILNKMKMLLSSGGRESPSVTTPPPPRRVQFKGRALTPPAPSAPAAVPPPPPPVTPPPPSTGPTSHTTSAATNHAFDGTFGSHFAGVDAPQFGSLALQPQVDIPLYAAVPDEYRAGFLDGFLDSASNASANTSGEAAGKVFDFSQYQKSKDSMPLPDSPVAELAPGHTAEVIEGLFDAPSSEGDGVTGQQDLVNSDLQVSPDVDLAQRTLTEQTSTDNTLIDLSAEVPSAHPAVIPGIKGMVLEAGRDSAIGVAIESMWIGASALSAEYGFASTLQSLEDFRMAIDMSAVYGGGRALHTAGVMAHAPTVAGLAEGFLPALPTAIAAGAATDFLVTKATDWAKTSDVDFVQSLGETFTSGGTASRLTTVVGAAAGGSLPWYLAARSPMVASGVGVATPFLGAVGGAFMVDPLVGKAFDAMGVEESTGRTAAQGGISLGAGYGVHRATVAAGRVITQAGSAAAQTATRVASQTATRVITQTVARTAGHLSVQAMASALTTTATGTATTAAAGTGAGAAVATTTGVGVVAGGGLAATTAPVWAVGGAVAAGVVTVGALGYAAYRFGSTTDGELNTQLAEEAKQDDAWGRFLNGDSFTDGLYDAVVG